MDSPRGYLKIVNVTLSDSGEYTCVVADENDCREQRSATLTVIPGQQAHIECKEHSCSITTV